MPKYRFEPEHPGHTFAVGKERARAIAGETYDLTEDEAEAVLDSIPGKNGPSLRLQAKAAAPVAKGKGRGRKAEPEPEADDDADDPAEV